MGLFWTMLVECSGQFGRVLVRLDVYSCRATSYSRARTSTVCPVFHHSRDVLYVTWGHQADNEDHASIDLIMDRVGRAPAPYFTTTCVPKLGMSSRLQTTAAGHTLTGGPTLVGYTWGQEQGALQRARWASHQLLFFPRIDSHRLFRSKDLGARLRRYTRSHHMPP